MYIARIGQCKDESFKWLVSYTLPPLSVQKIFSPSLSSTPIGTAQVL